jgi:hypothetical protein
MPFAVCRDKLTSTGAVVEVCGPVGTEDVVLVGFALLVTLLLVSPDLSEFSIPGLVSIKRRLAEQATRTGELERDLQRLEMTQQTNVSTTVMLPPNLAETASSAEKKAAAVAEGAVPSEHHELDPRIRTPSPERAVLEVQLLDAWETLVQYVGPPLVRGLDVASRRERFSQPERELLDDWQRYFRDELQELRLARNTVAHQPERLTDEQVRQAVVIGRALLQSVTEVLRGTASNQRS